MDTSYNNKQKEYLPILKSIFPNNIAETIFEYFYVEYIIWDFDDTMIIPLYLCGDCDN